jgi:predicted dehydrogenase
MLNVAIIGYGYSGKRFYDVLKVRQQKENDVNIVGICDIQPMVLQSLSDALICNDINTLFELSSNIDIVIVTVNEKYRFEVFEKLQEHKTKFKIIISEKLLTENISQAEKLLNMYNQTDIFVHFVERFSPVVSTFYDWITQNQLVVKRANFFWGKNRLYDKRPTIGVISEISHPLDLILYLSDVNYDEPINIESGNFVFSDYSSFDIDLLESINISLKTSNDLFIFGNSSFLWNARDRRITLFLATKGNKNITYIANLTFDNPYWDNDKCEIFELDNVGKIVKQVKTYSSNSTDDCLKGLNKIYNFLEEVINQAYHTESKKRLLPNLKSAVCIQKIVNDILNKAQNFRSSFFYFCY